MHAFAAHCLRCTATPCQPRHFLSLALALAFVMGTLAITGTSAAQAASVELHSSHSDLPAGKTATLTATADMTIWPPLYAVTIYETSSWGTGGTLLKTCHFDTCSVDVTSHEKTERYYIAYITEIGNQIAASLTTRVRWEWVFAPLPPTVDLKVDRKYNLHGETATLTATAESIAIPGTQGYRLKIYEGGAGTSTHLNSCPATTCSVQVKKSNTQGKMYTAYIAGVGSAWPPPAIQAASKAIYVEWNSIVINTSHAKPLVGQMATLTARSIVPANQSEVIEIRHHGTGELLQTCKGSDFCQLSLTDVGLHGYYATQKYWPNGLNTPPQKSHTSGNAVVDWIFDPSPD
jgi:hypothetical protein